MSVIHTTIEIEVPVRIAYDQWTQFEDFPRFMEGIEEVRQVDETHLHWRARIAGVTREWDARITEQIPDQLVAWTSVDGTRNDGLVTFEALAAHRCQVGFRMDLEPDGLAETLGDASGLIQARARGDLRRFKSFVEHRNRTTGSWRGEVDRGEVVTEGPPSDIPGEVAASTGGVVDLRGSSGPSPWCWSSSNRWSARTRIDWWRIWGSVSRTSVGAASNCSSSPAWTRPPPRWVRRGPMATYGSWPTPTVPSRTTTASPTARVLRPSC